MNMFMRPAAAQSLVDFDKGLEDYFASGRRFRSSVRRGSIILLDSGEEMSKFLDFLIDKCSLNVGVVHVRDAAKAKEAILELGLPHVKCVVIQADRLSESLNGDSLPSWLGRENPKVPIWVINCTPERRKTIRSLTSRIGVFGKQKSRMDVVAALGFPSECRQVASAYSG